jgi:hypothetical protein
MTATMCKDNYTVLRDAATYTFDLTYESSNVTKTLDDRLII